MTNFTAKTQRTKLHLFTGEYAPFVRSSYDSLRMPVQMIEAQNYCHFDKMRNCIFTDVQSFLQFLIATETWPADSQMQSKIF